MILDTLELDGLAASAAAMQRTLVLERPDLQQRHEKIQALLAKIARFFSQLSRLAHQTETSLLDPGVQRTDYFNEGSWDADWQLDLKEIRKGGDLSVSAKGSYVVSGAQQVIDNEIVKGTACSAAGLVTGSGAAAAGFFNADGKWDPRFRALVQAEASAFRGGAKVSVTDYMDAEAEMVVGAVHGEAKAVLDKNEATLSAQVGACAVRGSAKLSFKLGKLKIHLDLSGSAGSFEAGAEMSFKKREAIFGAKLGFIAGLGFRVRVEY